MSSAKAKKSVTLTPQEKTFLLDDAVFYELLLALGVSKHDATDYCVWEHLNFARMGHARALIYFFECGAGSKKWPDDLVAEDFGFPPSKIGISAADRDRLNKDLFHLSSSRLRHDAQTKPWPDSFLNAVHERAIAFVRFLLGPRAVQDYQVSEPKWRGLLALLESRQESIITRSFGSDGTDTGWVTGKGHALLSGLSELTKMART